LRSPKVIVVVGLGYKKGKKINAKKKRKYGENNEKKDLFFSVALLKRLSYLERVVVL